MVQTIQIAGGADLRARALAAQTAWEAQREAEREQDEASNRAIVAGKLAELLRDVLGVSVEGCADRVEIDGLTFTATQPHCYYEWSLVLTRVACPRCGQLGDAGIVTFLTDLGRYLRQIEQGTIELEHHDCPTLRSAGGSSASTFAKRLLRLVEEWHDEQHGWS
jgi:hypothetical protein